MATQIPIDNLDAGDDSPKLARASLKDVVVAVNRLCYAFKTPDTIVAPDALQLSSDGNLALGSTPLDRSSFGRNLYIRNNSLAGDTTAGASLWVESDTQLAFVNVKTNGSAAGVRLWNVASPTKPVVQQAWFPQERVWRQEMYYLDGNVQSTAFKISEQGRVGITEGSVLQSLLNIGSVGGTANEMWIASNTTTFEGAFLGAYDDRSGAKLDLNSQATSTTVSSWRVSHDSNDGGQGRLSFKFADAANSRASLNYSEKFALSSTGFTSFGGAARSVAGSVRYLHLENATGQSSIGIVRNSNDSNAPAIAFGKTRGTDTGSNTQVQENDVLGVIQFAAANGNHVNNVAARIYAFANGGQSTNASPGQLVFATTPLSTVNAVEAVRITNQQNVLIGATGDVARLTIQGGVTYPSGQGLIYLQSSNPSTTPVIIAGSSSGTTSISGGSPVTAGGARGGQIDLIGGGAPQFAGHAIIRTGTNADGLPGSNTFTFTPVGTFGVNTVSPEHRIHALGASGERIRVMMQTLEEYSGFTGRRANGSSAAPTKIRAGEPLVFFNTHGYTGSTYVAGGQISIVASSDWSDTATPSNIVIAPGNPVTPGQVTRTVFTSTGRVGINNTDPAAVFTVSAPWPENIFGIGFEVDPNPATSIVQVRSFDRSVSEYRGIATAASSHQWGVGTAGGSAPVLMHLTTAGNLAIGVNAIDLVANGTGNLSTEGNLVIGTSSSSAALFIQNGEKYSGLKIKAGPTTQSNGSCDYFDITTRPGISGVANNSDYVMIRMENAVGKNNPDMFLQTSGAGGRVVIGSDAAVSPARLNVRAHAGGGSIVNLSGLTTGQIASDLIIDRTGNASLNPGNGACIQLSNKTFDTHLLLQEYGGGFQLFNHTGTVWTERLFMSPTGRFSFGAHNTAANSDAETVQVIGGNYNGNDYCYFAQANTTTTAYAMRFFSATSSSLVGSISFTSSGTNFNQTSDRRMKENIVNAGLALDVVNAIQVRQFDFKIDKSHHRFGFIAQELYKVVPWAVNKGSDDNDEFNGLDGVWGVDNSKLIPLLIKSHQELSTDLTNTKQQLEDARARVVELERQMQEVFARLNNLDDRVK